jgi:RNA 2',3'-cyclic 3'-phosphodiesterase
MHLTLHFLGEADLARVASALESVAVPSFPLEPEGVGVFRSPNGAVTLWAGVRMSTALLALRSAVASGLAPEGFRPESRPYQAHITLGRYEAGATEAVVHAFLERFPGLPRMSATVESFSLYSSSFVDQVPVYRRERSYPLMPA